MKNKIIGIYEIISGLGGVIWMLLSFDTSTTLKMYFCIVSVLMFGLVFFSGLLLYVGKKYGLILSSIVQSLQILNFNEFNIKYIFCSGSKLSINVYALEIDFALIIEEIIVGFNSRIEEFVSINLIPIIILIFLIGNNRESGREI